MFFFFFFFLLVNELWHLPLWCYAAILSAGCLWDVFFSGTILCSVQIHVLLLLLFKWRCFLSRLWTSNCWSLNSRWPQQLDTVPDWHPPGWECFLGDVSPLHHDVTPHLDSEADESIHLPPRFRYDTRSGNVLIGGDNFVWYIHVHVYDLGREIVLPEHSYNMYYTCITTTSPAAAAAAAAAQYFYCRYSTVIRRRGTVVQQVPSLMIGFTIYH